MDSTTFVATGHFLSSPKRKETLASWPVNITVCLLSISVTRSFDAHRDTGWSYGLSGKLAKAPRFETMPSFDQESNALFKVHTHIDARGFVWVNLEAADKPSIPWGVDFEGSDKQQRLGQFNMDEFSFDHAWDMAGDYNWKTLVDNYNEVHYSASIKTFSDRV